MTSSDPVKNVIDALRADPLISDDFKRGLDSADQTHREFAFLPTKEWERPTELARQGYAVYRGSFRDGEPPRHWDDLTTSERNALIFVAKWADENG